MPKKPSIFSGMTRFVKNIGKPRVLLEDKIKSDEEKQAKINELARQHKEKRETIDKLKIYVSELNGRLVEKIKEIDELTNYLNKKHIEIAGLSELNTQKDIQIEHFKEAALRLGRIQKVRYEKHIGKLRGLHDDHIIRLVQQHNQSVDQLNTQHEAYKSEKEESELQLKEVVRHLMTKSVRQG